MVTLRDIMKSFFVKQAQVSTARRQRLNLESLESREVPAGLPFTEPEPARMREPGDAPGRFNSGPVRIGDESGFLSPVRVEGSIEQRGTDADLYMVRLAKGQVVTFDIDTPGGLDAGLRLLHADGRHIASNHARRSDDPEEKKSKQGTDPAIAFMAPADGEYVVAVMSQRNSQFDHKTGKPSYTPNPNKPIPPDATGAYQLFVRTPDVVAVGGSIADDRTVTVKFHVRNANLGNALPMAFFRSPHTQLDTSAELVFQTAISGDTVEPRGERSYSVQLGVDQLPTAEKPYLYVVLDPTPAQLNGHGRVSPPTARGRLIETDETNNVVLVGDRPVQSPIAIRAASLKDIDGGTLVGLSGWEHEYFGGMTRLHGGLTVGGIPGDVLRSVTVQVVEDGQVIATGGLSAAAAQELLNKPFGRTGRLSASGGLLFEIPSSQFPTRERAIDPKVTLRVMAESVTGATATMDVATVPLMVRYTKDNRYGNGRDDNRGGDDWTLPSVRRLMEQVIGVEWGDISNMNGGSFTPDHRSHQNGIDSDFKVVQFKQNDTNILIRDAATARWLIDLCNNPVYGSRIELVYVTYTPALAKALENVVLNNGKKATVVIQDKLNHANHFHVRWKIGSVVPRDLPVVLPIVVAPPAVSPPASTPLLESNLSYAFSSANFPDRVIRHRNFEAWLDQRDASELFKLDSGFVARPGLADPSLVSFESVNFPGRFLRHREMLIHLDANDGSNLYKLDATFRAVSGLNGTGVSFESVNFPGHFIRHEHFRLKIAANNGSELFRNDATFSATATTPTNPPVPKPLPVAPVRVPATPAAPLATNVWARVADLNWNRVSNADWVKVFRSADGVNFTEIGAVRGDQTRFRIEGLRPGTNYWFRLQSVNQFGNSPFSDTVRLTTKREAPVAPSGLIAENVWATRIDLNWTDRSENEMRFVVQMSTDGKTFREVGRTGANTTRFRVEQLRPNTRYWFRVLAINEIDAGGSTELLVTTKR